MNYNPRHLEEENWSFQHISKVDDKIIKKLVNNLKSDISDDFFISLESIIKLGSKAESQLKSALNEINEELVFKKEIFQFKSN